MEICELGRCCLTASSLCQDASCPYQIVILKVDTPVRFQSSNILSNAQLIPFLSYVILRYHRLGRNTYSFNLSL
jgi:hypothetical protein